MATYYAMSTENFEMCGMTILGVGETKDEAIKEAEDNLGPLNATDFRSQTWHKNLVCVSRSKAIKLGYIKRNFYPAWNEEAASYQIEW